MEAAQTDPQQRMTLDCVAMAMEDGGITRENLNGSETGVYIGINSGFNSLSTNRVLMRYNFPFLFPVRT
jgi:acyl transferase domain-containing protein